MLLTHRKGTHRSEPGEVIYNKLRIILSAWRRRHEGGWASHIWPNSLGPCLTEGMKDPLPTTQLKVITFQIEHDVQPASGSTERVSFQELNRR